MAIEFCSENCGVIISPMSPRISFSHDFLQSDFIPVEQQQQQHPFSSNPSSGLNSSNNIDFDFHVSQSHDLESSSAEELFSGGRILPTDVKKKIISPLKPHPPFGGGVGSDSRGVNSKNMKKEKERLKENEVCEKGQSSKSFWSFKRSSSCGSGGYGRSLCPLPLLSRSNSTGSTTSSGSSSSKRNNNSCSKEGINIKQQNSQKHSTTRFSHSYQKPPLNKSTTHHGNCVRVNPVLNVPTANLFGLGSIFSNKGKKK